MPRFIVSLIVDVEAQSGEEAIRAAKRYVAEHDDYDVEIERMPMERESQESKHCDAGYMNDVRFGEPPDA